MVKHLIGLALASGTIQHYVKEKGEKIMDINIGNIIKFYIDLIDNGVCIKQGKVYKIKEGFFTKKYLVETRGLLDLNTSQARWVKEGNILEILK